MNHDVAILIVDDDADIRRAVAEILADEGYLVTTAANGFDGLAVINDGLRPTLILLDLMMPEMNGAAFAEELRRCEGCAGIPIVVFSAASAPHESATAMGAVGCLAKPLRLADLLGEVERVAALSPALTA